MIRLSRSIIGEREIAAVQTVLERAFLGMGAEVERFEQELSAYLDGAPVACVNTGTAALHLALQAIGLGPGDEVLLPTLTYVASFQAVSACGAVPVACDVRERDGLLDLEDAARRVTPRTRAIMPVHYASYPGDLDAVYAFAQARQLRIVEDAAHAFGCLYKGKKLGSFGDVACFSFDGIKNITSGEGGAIVTHDAQVLRRVRDARLLGVEKDTDKRYQGERSWEFEVQAQGWRYHMSDIMAAIGRVQLTRLEGEFGPQRIRLAARYREKLGGCRHVRLFDNVGEHVIPHIFPVRIVAGKRDAVMQALNAQNIQTGMHYKPNHLLARFGGGKPQLPVAELLWAELLSLPLHPGLGDAELDRVCEIMHGA